MSSTKNIKKLRAKGLSYKQYLENKKGTSWKSKLKFDIDNSINQASDWAKFLELMQSKGYEIKNRKHIAFKHKDKDSELKNADQSALNLLFANR